MRNSTRFALLGIVSGLLAPTGLFVYGLMTERPLDPLALFLLTVAGGVIVLGTAGWRLGRKEDQLATRNRELQALSERLQALSSTDALTGIANRRSLDERLAVEVARTNRYQTPLAVVMIDLDHFKELNDRFGHQAGDVVLRRVAEILESEKRVGDMVARYGGEEFLAVLPHSDGPAATAWAERVRARLAATAFELDGTTLTVTASFGVASTRKADDAGEGLVQAADQALYEAKSLGRNRVELARPGEAVRATREFRAVRG